MAESKARWRRVLAIGQVLLAAALAFNATLEERIHWAQMDENAAATVPRPGVMIFRPLVEWGYIPTSEQILTAVNFPAFVALLPTTLLVEQERNFCREFSNGGDVSAGTLILLTSNLPVVLSFSPIILLGEKGIIVRGLFFEGIFFFWWWVGRWLDLRPRQIFRTRTTRLAIAGGGLLASLGLGTDVWFSYWGHSPLGHLGMLLWCLFGTVLFATMFGKTLRARPQTSATAEGSAEHR